MFLTGIKYLYVKKKNTCGCCTLSKITDLSILMLWSMKSGSIFPCTEYCIAPGDWEVYLGSGVSMQEEKMESGMHRLR